MTLVISLPKKNEILPNSKTILYDIMCTNLKNANQRRCHINNKGIFEHRSLFNATSNELSGETIVCVRFTRTVLTNATSTIFYLPYYVSPYRR